jgi:mRNA interferase RelE/StbE
MKTYKVEFTTSSLRDLKKMSDSLLKKIFQVIDLLKINPRPIGVKKLKGTSNVFRVKVLNYRIVYEIYDKKLIITIIKIDKRDSVYKEK